MRFKVNALLEDETEITLSSQEKLTKYLRVNSEDTLSIDNETFNKDFNVVLKSWSIEVIFKRTDDVDSLDIVNSIKKIINPK